MKIQITTQEPDEVQRFFSAPLSFSQKVMVKKSLIVWQILQRVKALGPNPSNPAARK
jgi:transcription initiation factor TFIIIB Brf1 subunit/transcription initiation factor TFIIB